MALNQTKAILDTIARVRRQCPYNRDILDICDVAEKSVVKQVADRAEAPPPPPPLRKVTPLPKPAKMGRARARA